MAITITAPAPAHLSNPLYNNTGNYDNEDANNTTALDRDLDLDSDADGDVDMLNTTGKSRNRSGRPKTKAILTPGECVTEDGQWMRGHGTTGDPYNNTRITSTVAGTLQRTNKLLSVAPLRARYMPEIGDLVIGRIHTVTPRKYTVTLSSPLHASLPLSSINLPGGVQRRRTAIDELAIRSFFAEGDLLVAEVQSLHQDGSASLHTRSLTYGKLRNGVFVDVGRTGVGRGRRQIWRVPVRGEGEGREVDVVAGVNGFVWIAAASAALSSNQDGDTDERQTTASAARQAEAIADASMYTSQNDDISAATRREIGVLAGIVRALARRKVRVDEEMVMRGYEIAGDLELEVGMEIGMDVEVDGDRAGKGEGKTMSEVDLGDRVVDVLVAEGG